MSMGLLHLTGGQHGALMKLAREQHDESIEQQMDSVRVLTFNEVRTLLDFGHLPSSIPRSAMPDGPSSRTVTTVDAAGTITGELMLWVKGGRISSVELIWYTDEPPDEFPDVLRVVSPDMLK